MGRAATPNYVGQTFNNSPPGHRFNLYFEAWDANWKFENNAKAEALRKTLSCSSAGDLLTGLRNRQNQLAASLPEPNRLVIDVRSTSPFATGLGLEHPVENGFAFLTPYGMPYLAGSGVKGVLRRAAEELMAEGEPGFDQPLVNALFGSENQTTPLRGALACWDVFPVPAKDRLVVEIMTPHTSHYLQEGKAPHDAGKPSPIPFLAVPAGSEFRFVVTCEPSFLPANMQPLWKPMLGLILQHAFDWLGFGAKTAVGYGAMAEDEKARAQRVAAECEQAEAARVAVETARVAALSPEEQEAIKLAQRLAAQAAAIAEFRDRYLAARQNGRYKAGGAFDQLRIGFFKQALDWQESASRRAAAALIRQTIKEWTEPPGNKERKAEFQKWLAELEA